MTEIVDYGQFCKLLNPGKVDEWDKAVINYMENMKLMQVRTAGTTANASLAMPTEKQEQQIKNLEYVKTVGTQYMVGSVAEKNDEGRDLSIALSYYDPTPTTFDALLYNSTLTLYVLDASLQL